MSNDETGQSRHGLRRSIGSGSVDATLLVGYVVAAGVFLSLVDVGGIIRTLVALPVLLFVPGYALVSVAFPGRARQPETPTGTVESSVGLISTGVPGWYERLALSFATSIALLPLFGLVLATTPWGFSAGAVLLSLGGFAIVGMVGAVIRRIRLPDAERFRQPVAAGDIKPFSGGQTIDVALNLVLVASVVLAMGALVYGLAAPQPMADSTEVQLLTETDDGELVAGEYPEAIPPGESAEMIVGVTSDGSEQSTYTVVIEAQHVQEDGNDLEVLESAELGRVQLVPEPGERATQETTVSPPMAGENIRLNYYLYEDDAPDEAGPETADDHLWITVEGV